MARTVNVQAYAAKRDDILTVVERLMYRKGFEQITIQDVLDGLQISKGAFYHYFPTKSALLEALVTRLLHEALGRLLPIVEDARLSAREQLGRCFATFFHWRAARRDLLLAILRVWYHDDNALVREKVRTAMIEQFTPQLATVIRRGIVEGAFSAADPERAAHVVVILRMALSEALASLLLSLDPQPGDLSPLERTIAAYTDAVARVLGIVDGGLQLADAEILKSWLVADDEAVRS